MEVLELVIFREIEQMAIERQQFFITNEFLVQELVRRGYRAKYKDIVDAANRIYAKLSEHPNVFVDPIENILLIRQ